MSKLNIVVLDRDIMYVNKLIGYFITNYQERFTVNSFTNEDIFLNFITKEVQNIDVLLISHDLYKNNYQSSKINTVIILTEGVINKDFGAVKAINKYQRMNNLVSSILNIFSENAKNEVYLPVGERRTKVIGVYSVSGGAGKTSVSAAASILSARNKKEIFYLNFENINSTRRFFENDSNQNMSKLFYYIKEKDKNLQLKIEALKNIDSNYNVHYFLPADSVLELDDISPDEYALLINKIRSIGQYEYVFIDMDNSYSLQNIELFKLCDMTMVLIDYNPMSDYKVQVFEREVAILSNRLAIDLFKKFMPVINKYNPNMYSNYRDKSVFDQEIEVKIPFDIKVYSQGFLSVLNDERSLFTKGIKELLWKI